MEEEARKEEGRIGEHFGERDFLLEVQSAGKGRGDAEHRGADVGDVEVIVCEEEGLLLGPQVPLETGVDLVRLAEVVAHRLYADQEGEAIAVFRPAPDRSFFVHHARPIGLLVVLEYAVMVDSEEFRHYIVDLATL